MNGRAQRGSAVGSALLIVGVLSLGAFFARFMRATNADAASRRGVADFSRKQFAPAVNDFTTASSLRPSPHASFNLGTAQIAAGKREEGSATIAKAMSDPRLRADAFYNRGNSALEAGANEYAIRDYIAALKLRPSDMNAKRNLEIALAKKKQQEQKAAGPGGGGGGGSTSGGQGGGGGKQGPQKKPTKPQDVPQPGPGQAQQSTGMKSAQMARIEALLRGIQQQEAEALQQMKRSRAEGKKVGW